MRPTKREQLLPAGLLIDGSRLQEVCLREEESSDKRWSKFIHDFLFIIQAV